MERTQISDGVDRLVVESTQITDRGDRLVVE